MSAASMTKDHAEQTLNDGLIDIAALGEPFIAHLDLVERLCNGCPLLKLDRALCYDGGAQEYTDYPTYLIN